MRAVLSSTLAVGGLLVMVGGVEALPPGIYDWQLQPSCNRIFATVTAVGGVVTVEGYDDQCGALPRLPVTGVALDNGDGTYRLGLHTVTALGVPVQINVDLNLGLSGLWRDSQGRNGNFALGGGAAGPPLTIPTHVVPPSSITASQINAGQVQRRVVGVCPAGQAMRAVGANGSVSCVLSGDVMGVIVGPGLSGGGFSGNVPIQANFGGSGVATSVARSDHTHGFATDNTSVGEGALPITAIGDFNTGVGRRALGVTTAGTLNAAVGVNALAANTEGHENVAIGAQALMQNLTGDDNVAVGFRALESPGDGSANTAVGEQALRGLRAGNGNTAVGGGAMNEAASGIADSASDNTAVGHGALSQVRNGSRNIAIGHNAGNVLTTGDDNIYIQANAAGGNEAATLRLGSNLTRAFIGGVRGVATGAADAVDVMIDSNGQLGTVSSSRRTKDDIATLDPDVSRAIFQLRPVQFRYKRAYSDGSSPTEYGLIAEEVAEVLPSLAATGASGEIETVKYHVLPTLLLAEVQRLERDRTALTATVEAQAAAITELRAVVARLESTVSPGR